MHHRRSCRRPQAARIYGKHLLDLLERQSSSRKLRGAQLQVRLRSGERAGRQRVSGGEKQPVHLLVERAGVSDGALQAESECTLRSDRPTESCAYCAVCEAAVAVAHRRDGAEQSRR